MTPSINTDELDAARREAQAAGDDLSSALRSLSRGVDNGEDAVRQLRELLEQAGDAMDELREAGDTIEELSSLASGISDDLSDVLHELSEMPTITVQPISSEIQEQGDALGDIFSDLLDDGDALRESMSSSTDILLDDLDAINDQFGVITDLLRDILDGSDEEFEDRFEDVSDEAPETTDTGYLSDARNDGTVEGDINVAGIVGSMAIEYDFDPEDDLIQEGDRSLDFRYQTKAVVASCINTGEITGKQDYAGGIVGLMDLGRVGNCENYGAVSSSNGDYVGGIALRGQHPGQLEQVPPVRWGLCGRRGRTGGHPGELPYPGDHRRGLRLSGRRGGRGGQRRYHIRQHIYQREPGRSGRHQLRREGGAGGF